MGVKRGKTVVKDGEGQERIVLRGEERTGLL